MGLAQAIAGLLEGILGSIGPRAFLFLIDREPEARQLAQVLRDLLFRSEGSLRNKGRRRF